MPTTEKNSTAKIGMYEYQAALEVLNEIAKSAPDTIEDDEAREAFTAASGLLQLIDSALDRIADDLGERHAWVYGNEDEEMLCEFGQPETVGYTLYVTAAERDLVEKIDSFEYAAGITDDQLREEWEARLLRELKRGRAA